MTDRPSRYRGKVDAVKNRRLPRQAAEADDRVVSESAGRQFESGVLNARTETGRLVDARQIEAVNELSWRRNPPRRTTLPGPSR